MTQERRLLAGALAITLVVSAATVGVAADGTNEPTVTAGASAGPVTVSDLTLVLPDSQQTWTQPPEMGVVVRNETVTVEATVRNAGNTTATRTVELRVDLNRDGTPTPVGANESVTLDPGENRTVVLNYSTKGIRGDTFLYGVFSGDDNATGHLSVAVPTDAENASVTLDNQTVPADAPTPVVRSATLVDGGLVWIEAPTSGYAERGYVTAWVPNGTTVRNLTTTYVGGTGEGFDPSTGKYEATAAKNIYGYLGGVDFTPYQYNNGTDISDTATVTVGQPPTVDAGEDATVDSNRWMPVRLTADPSDPDQTYDPTVEWEQVAGPSVPMYEPAGGTLVEFEVPAVPSETTLTFRTTAIDANGNAVSDVVNVTVRADESAEPNASFAVTNLSATDPVDRGTNASVSATMVNVGDATATQTVSYAIDTDDDGAVNLVGTNRSVTLGPGENRTVAFDAPTAVDSPGTYIYGVVTAGVAQTDEIHVREAGIYFQVDFVAGEPMELGADRLYADQDRLLRWVHGVTRDHISLEERGRAWASESVRECVDASRVEFDGATAEASFSVAEGCSNQTLSLVTYTKPAAGFSRDTAGQQELFDATTRTFSPGNHTVTVALPDNGTATGGVAAWVRTDIS